eukprot:gene9449-2801_t
MGSLVCVDEDGQQGWFVVTTRYFHVAGRDERAWNAMCRPAESVRQVGEHWLVRWGRDAVRPIPTSSLVCVAFTLVPRDGVAVLRSKLYKRMWDAYSKKCDEPQSVRQVRKEQRRQAEVAAAVAAALRGGAAAAAGPAMGGGGGFFPAMRGGGQALSDEAGPAPPKKKARAHGPDNLPRRDYYCKRCNQQFRNLSERNIKMHDEQWCEGLRGGPSKAERAARNATTGFTGLESKCACGYEANNDTNMDWHKKLRCPLRPQARPVAKAVSAGQMSSFFASAVRNAKK